MSPLGWGAWYASDSMSRRYAMLQVDVFTESPLAANPLAAFPDGAGLSDAEMQAIARATNLSETAFVLPAQAPGADDGVRIFMPTSELPFAGHRRRRRATAIRLNA